MTNKTMRMVARLDGAARTLSIGVLALSVVIMAAVVVLIRTGHQFTLMESGSMAPAIPMGSVVAVARTQPGLVRAGDVIAFTRPVGEPISVTHRVLQVDQTSAGIAFVTKGDANQAADRWKVHYLGDAWRVAFSIPYLGFGIVFLQTLLGRAVLAILVFLIALSLLLPENPRANPISSEEPAEQPEVEGVHA